MQIENAHQGISDAKKLFFLVQKAVHEDTGFSPKGGTVRVDCFYHKYVVIAAFAEANKQKLLDLLFAHGDIFSPSSLQKGIDHDKVTGSIAEEFRGHRILELFAFCQVAGFGKVLLPRERIKRGFAKPENGDADLGIVTLASGFV